MKLRQHIFFLSLLTWLSGCASLFGFTGADGGVRHGDRMEYQVIHPGLNIKIIEPYSEQLLPISTVGQSSPTPLRHTVRYGTEAKPHIFEIVGKYEKKLFLDGKYYGTLWSGDVLINDGVLWIDGKAAAVVMK